MLCTEALIAVLSCKKNRSIPWPSALHLCENYAAKIQKTKPFKGQYISTDPYHILNTFAKTSDVFHFELVEQELMLLSDRY